MTLHRRLLAAVTIIYTALAVVLTWPLTLHMGDALPGTAPVGGDNFEAHWHFWWVLHALQHGLNPWLNPDVFPQAGGFQLGSAESHASATYLFLPLTAIAGPTWTYNVVMMVSFVLCGLGVFLLARRLSASAPAAFVAGVAFAFGPFHVLETYVGHLGIAQAGYIPLAFWAVDRFLERHRLRDGVLAGILGALASLSSWYFMAFLALTLPAFAWLRRRHWQVPWHELGPGAAAGMVVLVLMVAPFLVPSAQYSLHSPGQPFFDSVLYSASVADYLDPPGGNPLDWLGRLWYPAGGSPNYPGVLVLAFVTVALVWRRARSQAFAIGTVALVAAVLSYGPVLKWLGQVVVIDPGFTISNRMKQVAHLVQPSAGPTASAVPLPAFALLHVPLLSGLRAWARAGGVADMALATMAALGMTALFSRFRGGLGAPAAQAAVAAALALVVLGDTWYPHDRLNTVSARPVDTWLARQPQVSRIIELPYAAGASGTQLLYQEYNHQQVTLCQAAHLPSTVAANFDRLYNDFPSRPGWVATLRQWRVRYLLVDDAFAKPGTDADIQSFGLVPVTKQGAVSVYQMPGSMTGG